MEHANIIYTPIDQQINKLISQGLIINDIDFAKHELQLYGYSNLIKSYRDPYTYTIDNHKRYRSGITFEHIHSLYIMDKNLRNAVMASMLDLEEYIKEAAADVISASFGIRQDQYLNYRNYANKRKRSPRFSLPGILDTLKKTIDTDKDPIFHYQSKYGFVPPWILFKGIYLSTIVNFIDQFKSAEKNSLIAKLYNTSALDISEKDLSALMMDTLFICLEYRNLAAHDGRIYNHESSYRPRFTSFNKTVHHGFSFLLFLLDHFNYKAPFSNLEKTLLYQLNRHCGAFPEDITYLGQILNINITPIETVWTTPNSSIYHQEPTCSGLKNPTQIELSVAKSNGLRPCKRCCK